jgi:uncharacterized membrane protein
MLGVRDSIHSNSSQQVCPNVAILLVAIQVLVYSCFFLIVPAWFWVLVSWSKYLCSYYTVAGAKRKIEHVSLCQRVLSFSLFSYYLP